jgi:hypothetical protein
MSQYLKAEEEGNTAKMLELAKKLSVLCNAQKYPLKKGDKCRCES